MANLKELERQLMRVQQEEEIRQLEERIISLPDEQVEERIELRKKLIKKRTEYGLTINI